MQKYLRRIDNLQKVIEKLDNKNLFLVTGADSYVESGAQKHIASLLSNCKVTHFKNIASNPKLEDIKRAIDSYRHSGCEVVLAIGGGSVIDVAKATFVLSAQEGILDNIVKRNELTRTPGGLLIAAPTTAGSGAESTHFAVVYIDNRKYSLSHSRALPSLVVLDQRLTHSLPPNITATSGIDAVAQAMESYWSIQSTALSRRYSRQALLKLLPNIESAVLCPNTRTRRAMLEGANLAGRAIDIAKTTACHAMSYGFTAHYGTPHGQAVAYSLPNFITFNAAVSNKDCQDLRGVEFVIARMEELYKILEVKDASSAKRRIEELIDTIKLNRQFSYPYASSAKTNLIDSIDPCRMSNNPRKVNSKDIQSILSSIVGA